MAALLVTMGGHEEVWEFVDRLVVVDIFCVDTQIKALKGCQLLQLPLCLVLCTGSFRLQLFVRQSENPHDKFCVVPQLSSSADWLASIIGIPICIQPELGQ